MKIIIDTNIIHHDYHLHGKHILTLTDVATRLGYEVLIPEVVVDEIESQFCEEVSSAVDGYYKSLTKIVDLSLAKLKNPLPEDFCETQCHDFRIEYEAALSEMKIRILPYPKVPHKDLVAKELHQRKPFRDSKKGYRDALIWETVKEELIPSKDLLDECQILFLTENTRDFADGNFLHPDLVQELLNLGFKENVIELRTDCNKFFETEIFPQFQELDNIKQALNTKGSYNRISIKEDFAPLFGPDFVDYIATDVDDMGLNTRLPLYCETPYVESVYDPVITTESVIRLADGSVLISCNVTIDAEISYYLERSNMVDAFENAKPHIINPEHNDHYMEASNMIELRVKVNFRASRMLSKLISTEVIPGSISFR